MDLSLLPPASLLRIAATLKLPSVQKEHIDMNEVAHEWATIYDNYQLQSEDAVIRRFSRVTQTRYAGLNPPIDAIDPNYFVGGEPDGLGMYDPLEGVLHPGIFPSFLANPQSTAGGFAMMGQNPYEQFQYAQQQQQQQQQQMQEYTARGASRGGNHQHPRTTTKPSGRGGNAPPKRKRGGANAYQHQLQQQLQHLQQMQQQVVQEEQPEQDYGILERGRQVAANIEDDQWILMTVLKYSKRTKVYRVEDGDEMAQPPKQAFEISRDFVIPLPDRNSPQRSPQYPVGAIVFAMYPGTTSFYGATVAKVIRRNNNSASGLCDYMLYFDDDQDASGETPMKKVKGEYVLPAVLV